MKDDEDILIRGYGFILFIVAMILLVVSCGVCHDCEYKQNIRDSIYIEKIDTLIHRDTIINVQMRDSVVFAVVDSSSHLETDVALSDAWIEGGKLHHSLENKTTLIPIQVSFPNGVSIEKHYLTRVITQEVEREMKWHETARMKMGEILLFLIVAFVFYKVIATFVGKSIV